MASQGDEGDVQQLIDSSGNSLFDQILHLSLIVGAVFQLVCIFAVVFLPPTSEEKENESQTKDSAKVAVAPDRTSVSSRAVASTGHRKRLEKKKRK